MEVSEGKVSRDEGRNRFQVPPKDGSVRSPMADSGVRFQE